MSDDNHATTIIEKSPAQAKLEKLDRRDKFIRAIELLILAFVVGFNIFLGLRLQDIIDQNNREAVQRSADAAIQRDNQEDYVKCVVLINFDYSVDELGTRDAVENALDKCARAER